MEVPFLVAAAQRRSVRRYVRMDCQVVRERGFRLIGRHALDLSTTGMRVAALDRALTGDPVILSFRVPGTETWVDAEGTVARVVHGRRSCDRGPSYAIEMHGIPDDLRGVLRRQLLKWAPAIPQRSSRIDWAASVRRIGDL
ncbi:MAG: PilZ domain-containing protein [Deltaproteobacteria bacterium]|nr:PilZ domain-containing protein [Deltaproteobacteria bacterium]